MGRDAIEDITPKYAGYFRAFLSWWKTRKPEPLATERRVYHKVLLYAGTVDLICEIKGRLTLVDYKSSASVNSKLCGVQLEGYDRALESHGIKVDEVSFSEYNKGQANWKSKPATMINKVAISQCVRSAFPKDYEGVYSEEEMVASGAIPANYTEVNDKQTEPEDEDPIITQEQRKMLFKTAQSAFGKQEGNRRLNNGRTIIAGPFFVCGLTEQDFRGLTDAEVQTYLARFALPEYISQEEVEANMGFTIYGF